MRWLLNILAGIIAVFGVGCALGNLGLLGAVAYSVVTKKPVIPPDSVAFSLILLGGALCFFGAFVAYRAWEHLRRPNARTASDVIGIGLYLAFFSAVTPLLRHHPYVALSTLVGIALLRRFLNSRLTTQLAALH